MAGASILKNTFPVEPPMKEKKSWFVTSNQESYLCGIILMIKGSLLLRALMLMRFPLQIGEVKKRVEILMFFEPEAL